MNDLKYIFGLFKSAAKDLPAYFPKWVAEDDRIKQIDYLSSVNKKIPIENYRESAELNTSLLKDKLIGEISLLVDKFIRSIKQILSLLEIWSITNKQNDIRKAASELREAILSVDIEEKILDKKISVINSFVLSANVPSLRILKNTLIKKSLEILFNLYVNTKQELFLSPFASEYELIYTINEFTSLPNYEIIKKMRETLFNDDNSDNLQIVFSKDPKDILGLASRSEWYSCLDITKQKRDRYNFRAISTALSPYVGIIYLTNGNDFQGRGETMIARSIVYLLTDKTGNMSNVIALSDPYTNYVKKDIFELFKNSLKKHTSLQIIPESAISENHSLPTNDFPSPYFEPGVGALGGHFKGDIA